MEKRPPSGNDAIISEKVPPVQFKVSFVYGEVSFNAGAETEGIWFATVKDCCADLFRFPAVSFAYQ